MSMTRKGVGKTNDWQNRADLEDPTSLLDQVYLGFTQRAAQVNNGTVIEHDKFFHQNEKEKTCQCDYRCER